MTSLRQTWLWVRDPIGFLDDMVGRYGHGTPFTMRRVGGMTLVLVSDPAHVKEVFLDTETYLAGRAQAMLKNFIGEHTLFALDGAQHKRHRRLTMPPFVGERMRAYGTLMRDLTLEDMKSWPVGEPFPLVEPMTRVTLEVIFQAVFGVHDPAVIARLTELIHKLTGGGRALLAYMPFLQVNLGSWSPYGRFLKTQEEFDRIIYDEIAKARANPEGREDILARVIAVGAANEDPFTDAEIRDELVTMLAAGHETTASGLCWAFQWLLGLPDVLAKAQAELSEVFGDGPFDPARLKELKYLEAAVQESLRLNPPVPNCGRWVAKDTELAGFKIPAGHYVCPCPYLTHRNPEIYPEPDRFKPERFLEKRPSPWEFYPFGGGRRLCIGLSFAVYEMTVVLGTILHTAKLRLTEPPSHDAKRKAILVVPRNGTPVVYDGPRRS